MPPNTFVFLLCYMYCIAIEYTIIHVATARFMFINTCIEKKAVPEFPTQGYHFGVFDASGLVPPPSPWTDASGLSVDASGPVPPPSSSDGGGRGGQPLNYYKMYNIVCTMLNNHGIT